MKLSMWNLYHELSSQNKLPMINDGTCTINGARWLVTTNLSSQHVYVGSAGDYFEVGGENSIIVHRRDMILVKGVDPEELFDEVCGILEKFNIWEQRLSDLLETDNGLQRMIDLSKDILGNPSYIYSPVGEILAIASDYPSSVHWHWKELIDNRGLSEKRLKFLKDNIHLSSVFEDTIPVRRKSVMDEYEYIHCSIFCQKRIVGHFVLFGFTDPIPEGMEYIIGHLIQFMNRFTDIHYQQFSSQSKLTDVFLGFLEKEPFDRGRLADLLRSFQWKTQDPWQVLVIREAVSSEPVLLTRISRRISEEVPRVLSSVRDERLIILRNLRDPAGSAGEYETLMMILGNDFYIGISSTFRGFENAELYYRQARAELERCEKSGLQRSDGGNHLTDSLQSVIRSNDLLKAYVEPVLLRLQEHDSENGTAFYETFSAYCLSGFHKSETAAILSLHRNSLNYRLERIAELLGQDVFYNCIHTDDPEHLKRLVLSCFILDCFSQKNSGESHLK